MKSKLDDPEKKAMVSKQMYYGENLIKTKKIEPELKYRLVKLKYKEMQI